MASRAKITDEATMKCGWEGNYPYHASYGTAYSHFSTLREAIRWLRRVYKVRKAEIEINVRSVNHAKD